MILFCGIPSEEPLALAIEAARRARVPHVVFNQRQSRAATLTLELDRHGLTGTLACGDRTYDLTAFTGVYSRLLDPSQLPEHRTPSSVRADETGARRARVAHDLLVQWMQLAACRVANRPRPMLSNASKPYQAQRIAAAGFLIPPTLITNAPEAVADFGSAHPRVIFKSVSAVRSIVRELTPDLMSRLDRVRNVVTQFQAHIPGDDIRVHVVGDRVFATRVTGRAIDYRYASRDGVEIEVRPTELPADIAERSVRLSRSLDLPFCGIDLRETPHGEYYCFEVNPSPAYSYYEHATGQPIACALVEWLRRQHD